MRIDERRRQLTGRPAAGRPLLTSDAGPPDCPFRRARRHRHRHPGGPETDYGRVDDHVSASARPATRTTSIGFRTIRLPARRVQASGPADGSAPPVRPPTPPLPNVSPAERADGRGGQDSATAWVSNSLQPAIGQWLQIDFDRPITNAKNLTLTPSATAVSAQVRRIQVSTGNGTTTVSF